MALPGCEQFRSAVLRYVELPGARFLRALKFTPNSITLIGFAVTVAAAVLVGYGWLFVGGIVFLSGSALDLMEVRWRDSQAQLAPLALCWTRSLTA